MADLPVGRVTIRDREQAGPAGGRLTLGGEVVSLGELTRRARAEGAREEREAAAGWLIRKDTLRAFVAECSTGNLAEFAGWAALKLAAGEHRKEADRA